MLIPDRIKNFNFVLINPEKEGKTPLEKAWQKKEHRFDDDKLLKHLEKGYNYGVRTGKTSSITINGNSYFLLILDFDNKDFQDKVLNQLPETYTTTSGSPKHCLHLWFASDNDKSFKILDENNDTLADVLGEGKQIIAPNSKHKSGSVYSIVKDIPFTFIPYSELKALLMPYDKSPKKPEKEIKNPFVKSINENIGSKAVSQISLKQCLEECGVDTSKDPTSCPFHSSKGGKCLSWNNNVTCHCFHCDNSWNNYSLIREYKKLSDKQTYEWFAEKTGLSQELKKERREYVKGNVNVNKNTTTPPLPTTTYYIKSWGYFDKDFKIHIEQVTPFYYIYNLNGKRGLVDVQTAINEQLKPIYRFIEIEDKKFILPKVTFEAKQFYNIPSLELCRSYLKGEYKPRSYLEISKDVKKSLKELFDFNDEVDIEMTNLCIGQSWIKPRLNQFFFYMIDSSLGGGKTTLGEIVFFLCRHGFMGGNISSASIPRLTNELDLNIFIDEIDQNLRDDDVLAILRKGQRRGNPYVRCEGRDNRPTAYDVAGSHGGSFRSELEDAFMNRSLRVHTKRTKDYMLPVVNTYKKEILKPLVDELFLWHLDNLVVGCSDNENPSCYKENEGDSDDKSHSCSNVAGRNGVFIAKSRKQLFLEFTKHFTKEENEFLEKVFGRDSELTYLCLEVARILKLNILDHLKVIMSNRARDEASSEGFYLEAIKQLIFLNMAKIVSKTLKDGNNVGYPFYPKNRLYQDFMAYLKELNVQTIGTKRYSSLLRDLGFVEGETIMSQRYEAYPSPCLIFNKKICDNLDIPFDPIKSEEFKFDGGKHG